MIENYIKLISFYKNRFDCKQAALKSNLLKIEGHHIVPKCLGGSDDRNNIVFVSREEHIELHKMLCLCFSNQIEETKKLTYAFDMMVKKQPTINGQFQLNKFLKSNSILVKYVRRWNKKVDNFQDIVNLFLQNQPSTAEKFNNIYQEKFNRPIKCKIAIFTFLKYNFHNLV